ncbi:helix-turn-helix domain-containing protein [Achromobacter spanius]|uniref:helix-turn-helix domain-containing protein n=1 Tax=Achromobacter spanius TaxID=217203 RepID=UPI003209845B
MNNVTTHMTPILGRPDRNYGAHVPAVKSVMVLAGVSGLVRDAFGDSVLRQAKQAVMLDIEAIEGHECFIPQVMVTDFLWEIERRSKEVNLGLLAAPVLSVKNYGSWGKYILAADSLGEALARAATSLNFHSTGDRMQIVVDGAIVRICFVHATRGRRGYSHVASGTVSVVCSILRAYLGAGFLPHRVELDVPRPPTCTHFEDAFRCPVLFDAPTISICIDAPLLKRQAPARDPPALITIEDVARSLSQPVGLGSYLGVVAWHIRAQVQAGVVSIDSTARAMGTSVRTLQRILRRDNGVDFRELANAVRLRRAEELLRGTTVSITQIAMDFGYSSPANFSRAFRKASGLAPHEYRQKLLVK